jgi:transposase
MGSDMGEFLRVEALCPVAEVAAGYRRERDAVRRSHLQVIWLLLDGMAAPEVAGVTGFSGRWIEKLIHRWNAAGLAGLGDRRRNNPGKSPVLDAAGLAALSAVLEGAPPDGGLWSGRKVAAWMSARLGRPVDAKLGLAYLHRLDYTRQMPRPQHAKAADAETQAAYKKTSARRWLRRRPRTPAARWSSGLSTSTGSG